MPLQPSDIQAIATKHAPYKDLDKMDGPAYCHGCPGGQEPWPCDAATLAMVLLRVELLPGMPRRALS